MGFHISTTPTDTQEDRCESTSEEDWYKQQDRVLKEKKKKKKKKKKNKYVLTDNVYLTNLHAPPDGELLR
jgi:Icc-related predicted phosphoesterase